MPSDHLGTLSVGLSAFHKHPPGHSYIVICENCSLWGDPDRWTGQSDESNNTTAGTNELSWHNVHFHDWKESTANEWGL